MDNEKKEPKIIDWTDRKAAMDTYRKYEEIGATGPCYRYYNGKLLPAGTFQFVGPETVPYKVDKETEDGNK